MRTRLIVNTSGKTSSSLTILRSVVLMVRSIWTRHRLRFMHYCVRNFGSRFLRRNSFILNFWANLSCNGRVEIRNLSLTWMPGPFWLEQAFLCLTTSTCCCCIRHHVQIIRLHPRWIRILPFSFFCLSSLSLRLKSRGGIGGSRICGDQIWLKLHILVLVVLNFGAPTNQAYSRLLSLFVSSWHRKLLRI